MKKWMFTVMGFNVLMLVGNFVLVACSTSNAASPVSAVDITFDNTGTGLSATTLQGAIAELAERVGDGSATSSSFDNEDSGLTATTVQAALTELAGYVDEVRAGDISSLLTGTWSGNEKDEDVLDQNYNSAVSVTFNSNGTYSCTTFGKLSDSFTANVCSAPVSWVVNGRVLEITYTLPGGFNASGKIELPIHHASSSKLILIDGSDDAGMRTMFLTKS